MENKEQLDLDEELDKRLQQIYDPSYLHTTSMPELYEKVYQSNPPIIEGLLYPGTYIFAGAPKLGKSFLALQLAYHVSTGAALWGFTVRKCTVLYLALEDDEPRLQHRMARLFGTDVSPDLHTSILAKKLGDGLQEQLRRFTQEHPDTKLIIIDTLQKVLDASDSYSYSRDYQNVGNLKKVAEELGICLLLVHHTRKQQADDRFDMISGTNGVFGAADGGMVLEKERRTGNTAILEITGRDQQDQRLHLHRDMDTLRWELDSAETELWKEPDDPVLEAVAKLVSPENPCWNGSPSALADALQTDMKPNTLTMRLNISAISLYHKYKIRYENTRTHAGRKITLTLDLTGP